MKNNDGLSPVTRWLAGVFFASTMLITACRTTDNAAETEAGTKPQTFAEQLSAYGVQNPEAVIENFGALEVPEFAKDSFGSAEEAILVFARRNPDSLSGFAGQYSMIKNARDASDNPELHVNADAMLADHVERFFRLAEHLETTSAPEPN